MNESDFKDILAEICEEEIAEFNALPSFKPSLRHRLAMKRIFALFEKNCGTKCSPPIALDMQQGKHLRLNKKLVITIAAIICAVLLTGFCAVYYFSNGFRGTVHNDNTQLFAVNTEGCLTTIEYKYYLPELPEGFELTAQGEVSSFAYTRYENELTGQGITLTQFVKSEFDPYIDTEHHDFEEIEINGHSGLCIDFSDNYSDYALIILDNDDYILEIIGDLTKKELIDLAKNSKILEK